MTKHVVKETVSLRDLAATIVDVLDMKVGSPFPGSSLARYWDGKPTTPPTTHASLRPGALRGPPRVRRPMSTLTVYPEKSWPLGALNDGDWSYIRGEGNVHEELFRVSQDAWEQHNLARDPAARPILERMRQTLVRLTGGPLRTSDDSIVDDHAGSEIGAAITPQSAYLVGILNKSSSEINPETLALELGVCQHVSGSKNEPCRSAGPAHIDKVSNPASLTEPARSDSQHQLLTFSRRALGGRACFIACDHEESPP